VEDLVMMICYGDSDARAGERWQFTHRDVRILRTEIHPASGDTIPF
jgi:hypothetical protein